MPEQPQGPAPREADERQRLKHEVLSHRVPSHVAGIAEAVTVKNGDMFFLSERDGFVPLTGGHGLGLYFHDCRYLRGYECLLDGEPPEPLVATSPEGFRALFQLTRSELSQKEEDSNLREAVEVKLERQIEGDAPVLEDRLTLRNYGSEANAVSLSISFQAAFEDVYAVRGLLPQPGIKACPPVERDGTLAWRYEGLDGVVRELFVCFSRAPDFLADGVARFDMCLEPHGSAELRVNLSVCETAMAGGTARRGGGAGAGAPALHLPEGREDWPADFTRLRSGSILLQGIVAQALRDLRTLKSTLRGYTYFAAGIPWFGTLFGRDSLLSAYQMLAYDPAVAGETLRLLASFQGRTEDEWREEEPGRILHELRIGELAHIQMIPHSPYYGAIDTTALFLIVMERYCAWTGDLGLFHDLRDHVERALGWIARRLSRDGYMAYRSMRGRRLLNRGWKDSGDAVVNVDGSLGRPPIAMVEVQAYVVGALGAIARLYERVGEPERARSLRQQAERLKARFNRDFWLPDEGCYAMALQAQDAPVAVVSSNAGQVLWAGAADPDKAAQVVDRLMKEDMYSGWGVRTLSTREKRYNPVSYHLGTVWPHDNALIAAGFRRYGRRAEAADLFRGLFDAATMFDHYRMPELFCGFPRADFGEPVHFPVACHPQAWAAGALPYLLTELLGFEPDACDGCLRLVNPLLPDFVDDIEFEGLRVGDVRVDLRFERGRQGVEVKVLRQTGPLEVTLVEDLSNMPRPGGAGHSNPA